jgi:quercetin dioxygenase-like cupin family protein
MRRSWSVTLLALVASFAVAGTALATHLPTFANVTTASARGTLAETVKYNADGIKVQTKNPVDVITAEVTFAAGSPTGASAGWHNHPGPVFVVIRSGTLSVWDEECVKHEYSAGDSFFEAGRDETLLVKNESTTTDARAYATFIVPVGVTPLRTGTPHLCGLAE